MDWRVNYHDKFREEFSDLPDSVKSKLTMVIAMLKVDGPMLNRPLVETLKGSRLKNLK